MRCSKFPSIARTLPLVMSVLLAVMVGSVASAAAPNAAAPAAAKDGGSDPLFGGTLYRQHGESYPQAYDRVTQTYGPLGAIRLFFRGLPQDWSKIREDVHQTPVVVSFKADPAQVVAGKYDQELRQWFADAPTDRPTFWSYWHEPENNAVTPAAYRAAWRHIASLAAHAQNPRLRATLILMCWTLDSHSGRTWTDYYAGDDTIDVVAFDCYNVGRRNGVYKDPADIIAPVIDAARSVGKPWGIAEFGSTVVNSDGGEQGRAHWLRQFARAVRDNDGRFATYFDSNVGLDFRLTDAPSRNAWRDIVQGG